MNKKQAEELTNEILVADAILRITALERLLITKGILTKEDINSEITAIAEQISKSILEKNNISNDLEDIKIIKYSEDGSKNN